MPLGIFERADGLSGRPGTPTPEGAIKVSDANGATEIGDISIEEDPESPEIERAEQATITHKYRLPWEEALNRLTFLGRGVIYNDPSGTTNTGLPLMEKILSTRIQHKKGGWGEMTVVLEGRNFDNPPDEYRITPVDLGVNILKFPRYYYAFLGAGQGSETELKNQMVITLLQSYFDNTTLNYRRAVTKLIKDSLSSEGTTSDDYPVWNPAARTFTPALIAGTYMAKSAALEIIQKYWRGEENPMLTGIELSWTRYYYIPQLLDLGGHIEVPWLDANPQFPLEFISTVEPPNIGATIFDALSYWNPQCYSTTGLYGGPVSIDWLRRADDTEYQRLWHRVHRTWWGAPVGLWDRDFYSGGNRPQVGGDYNVLNW